MSKKSRRKFSDEQKREAVDAYVSGRKTAAEVAAEHDVEVQAVYKWRVQLDEKAKGARCEELESMGHSPSDARRILALEEELEEYKKKLAEQILINDLLKKLQARSKNSQPESELTGLIRTTKRLDRKGGPAK